MLEAHAASAWDEIHLRACGQLESRRRRFSGEGRRQRLIRTVGAKKLQGKCALSAEHFGKPDVPLQNAQVAMGRHKAGLELNPDAAPHTPQPSTVSSLGSKIVLPCSHFHWESLL